MILTASPEQAVATRRRGESNGSTFWHTTFLGSNRFTRQADAPPPEREDVYPMAFLVEQDPNAITQSHFHQADQFQVVVAGGGDLGTHPIRDLAVHYAGAFTAYGPIRANAEGITYFTLRNGWDPGARYMPGARAELRTRRRAPHREATSAPMPPASAAELAGLGAVACDAVIAPEADGLAAWRWRVPPHAALTGHDPRASRGQTWLVTAGAIVRDGAALPRHACLFVFPGDSALTAHAGPDGAEVLCLQYPTL